MRTSVFLISLVVLSASLAVAQSKKSDSDFPKAEVFGGYSFLHTENGAISANNNFNGWEASLTGNVNKWLGFKADFDGHYNSDNVLGVDVSGKEHNFLFGPEVSLRRDKFKAFGHALFGVSHASVSALGTTSSDNAFAWAIGGGGDYMFTKRFGWRVVQADYLMTRFGGDSQNNARVSTGLVFHF
jgi:outer membrane protein with beta-barrel domain